MTNNKCVLCRESSGWFRAPWSADAMHLQFNAIFLRDGFFPVWCLRNSYPFAAMDSYFGDTTLMQTQFDPCAVEGQNHPVFSHLITQRGHDATRRSHGTPLTGFEAVSADPGKHRGQGPAGTSG